MSEYGRSANTPYNKPSVNSLAIAVVKKVEPFGAYCMLPEYNDIEVFLPIREVSSGWVKNIHEFVHEGQKIVCKIIFYDTNRNTIDVSLKKVTPKESKDKLRAFNLEKRSKALFSQAIKIAKEQQSKDSIESKMLADFGTYTKLIEAAKYSPADIDTSKLPKKFKEAIIKLIEASNVKRNYAVSYTLTVQTDDTKSGATKLRSVFAKAQKESGASITYVSAPKYKLNASGESYSEAEEKAKKAVEAVKSLLGEQDIGVEKEKMHKEKENILNKL